MRILLTGAGGFIGSRLLPALAGQGREVTVLTRPENLSRQREQCAQREIPCQFLAAASPLDWADAVKNRGFDVCVHLAWIATPGIYLHSPENEIFESATLALADRLFSEGLNHFIGAGTCIEYAPGQTEACREEATPDGPVSPYGLAKTRAKDGLRRRAEAAGRGWTWARIFYPYGEGEHPSRTASTFLRVLASGQPLRLKTGASVKDFIEVSDLVAALKHLTRGDPLGVVNLGTGTVISIRELAEAAARTVGADPELIHDSGDGIDPYAFHIADCRKLFATGWRPSVSLENGMARLRNSLHHTDS